MRYRGVNKFVADCASCSAPVPAKGGKLFKTARGAWVVYHLACEGKGSRPRRPAVNTFRFGGGSTYIRNANGRCEDAPCCGCCTI